MKKLGIRSQNSDRYFYVFVALSILALGAGAATDFKVYYEAALRLRDSGWEAVYQTQNLTPFKYHPGIAFFFVPFSFFPLLVAKWLWALANGWMLLDLGRRAAGFFGTYRRNVTLSFFCVIHALTWQWKFANVTFLMLWLLMVAADWGMASENRKAWLAAAATSFLILLKPTWILLVPILFATGASRWAARSIAGIAVFSLGTWLVAGSESYLAWSSTLSDPLHAHNYPKNDNQSWFALCYRWKESFPEAVTWIAGSALFTAAFVWKSWPYRKHASAVFLASALLWVWIGPLSWIHHQVLLVPLFIGILSTIERQMDRTVWTRGGPAWTLALTWFFLNGTGEIFWGRLGFIRIHQAGMPLLGLALLLWALPAFYQASPVVADGSPGRK